PAGFPKFTEGHAEDRAYTTNKVIVARSYVRQIAPGSDPANPAANSRPDDFSPRDRVGHGTAAASAAAANTTTAPSATNDHAAVKAGIVVVASAGNNGADAVQYPNFDTVTTPANSPNVIAVGASSNSHFFDQSLRVDGGPANLANLVTEVADNYFCTPYGGA